MLSARWIAVTLAALLISTVVQGYPIRPRTLWEQVADAELVVLATVNNVQEIPAKEQKRDSLVSHVAELQVLEVWKGRAIGSLRVPYEGNLVCPAPPAYFPGKQVVAFLVKSRGSWATLALSYGTLYPEADETGDLREMIQSAAAVQAAGARDSERVDWLVEAASRPATRWHGLYGLEPEGDTLHSYYDRRKVLPRVDLTREQRARIAAGFVQHPVADRTLPMVLVVLQGHRDAAVDRAAVAAVETRLTDPNPPWWLREAMTWVFARFGDPDPMARIQPLGGPFDDVAPEALRGVWREARRSLQIPEVPLGPRQSPRPAVGPDTPS